MGSMLLQKLGSVKSYVVAVFAFHLQSPRVSMLLVVSFLTAGV